MSDFEVFHTGEVALLRTQAQAWIKLSMAANRNHHLANQWINDSRDLPWCDFLADILRNYQPKEQS